MSVPRLRGPQGGRPWAPALESGHKSYVLVVWELEARESRAGAQAECRHTAGGRRISPLGASETPWPDPSAGQILPGA